jgi:hypothetical protein
MRSLVVLALITTTIGRTETLRITVYDRAELSRPVLDGALGELRRIFRLAGIEAEFAFGDPEIAEASLVLYPGQLTKDQIVRASCRARRDVALRIVAAPAGLDSHILGMALPLAPAGLNAFVYSDRVAAAAARASTSYETVLGHAIAHELGHVLLRTNAHEPQGMMAATWARQEYDGLARGAILFSGEQSRIMRGTLTGLGCPAEL